MRTIKFRTQDGRYLSFEVPKTAQQLLVTGADGTEIYENDIYLDIDSQEQVFAPTVEELVEEALGDNVVSLISIEIQAAWERKEQNHDATATARNDGAA